MAEVLGLRGCVPPFPLRRAALPTAPTRRSCDVVWIGGVAGRGLGRRGL